ncbi:inositol monophosphatase family protein [Actinomycetospora termitidis]|uniref:inositol-phosphate phosphatase n=1 Tax=Actinomycetospora termitidis TaxID=3053470 RepID=A0ABT7MHY1_9PSEU|nr:inositol monophosphatase family protein [Actinomycetospora sp. Odt1-22]MDL5160275.1 inositol monophosphatase family protein [Actinomycetospora sp. Odt1-22]
MTDDLQPDLALALRIADAADRVTSSRFRASDLRVDRKPDRTPVTDADVATEDEVRRILAAERPDDAVLGEERGGDTTATRHWIVDPIDGTKNYSRGVPVFATLLALVVDGDPVVGVVSAPALGRRWWAARGRGAFTSDVARGIEAAPLAVSGVADLADAYVSTTDLDYWREIGARDRWIALTEATWESRAFGDFHHHVLVAEGLLDAAVEPGASAWDLAAPAVVVREAGGRLTDFTGADRIDAGEALSTNGALHDTVLGVIRP